MEADRDAGTTDVDLVRAVDRDGDRCATMGDREVAHAQDVELGRGAPEVDHELVGSWVVEHVGRSRRLFGVHDFCFLYNNPFFLIFLQTHP